MTEDATLMIERCLETRKEVFVTLNYLRVGTKLSKVQMARRAAAWCSERGYGFSLDTSSEICTIMRTA